MTPDELAHLRRARDLMDREYARPLDVPAMAQAALMSPSHFARQFRAAYGETPYGYLMTRRIERAMALLRRGDLSVTEVCLAVGCTSLGSFSSRFTELVGETPSAYRARDHRAAARRARPASRQVVVAGRREPSRNGEAAAVARRLALRHDHLTLSHTFIIVDDQDKALAFYRDVLGLELRNDVTTSASDALADRRAAGAARRRDRAGARPSMGHSPQDADGAAARCWPRACCAASIFAHRRRATPTFEQLRAAGAEVLQEPIDQPYGCATARSATRRATTSGSPRRLCPRRDPRGARGTGRSAAVRTAGARRAVSSRLAHPVIEIAATACGPPSRTGAATHAIPTVDSSCSSATPRSRIRASSSASSPGATTVRGVRRASPAATTAASRSGGANASIALPTPVQ